MRLLDLDLRASLFELLLEVLGILLGHALLQSLRSGLDESLGLGQTQTSDLADSLDDLDLGSSVETGEDDVELGLLLGSGGSTAGSGSSPWTSSESSRTVRPLISSIIAVTFSLIVMILQF